MAMAVSVEIGAHPKLTTPHIVLEKDCLVRRIKIMRVTGKTIANQQGFLRKVIVDTYCERCPWQIYEVCKITLLEMGCHNAKDASDFPNK